MLEKLKMLLGIEDEKTDGILNFLIEDTQNLILGYCRLEFIPQQLESLIPVVAADMYRAKGYGEAAAPEIVKSISEGDRSVTLADTAPDNDFLSNYYNRLKPYMNRKGCVPSEVKSV